ncbi:hypothetical protein Q3G72_010352 [Acer saccharum]|nr:hypothetical protein Q3G72_010352 [Acer saccharum]
MKMKLGLRGAESEKMKMKLGLHGFEPGMENRIVWSWVCGFEKGIEKMMGDVGEEDCVVVGLCGLGANEIEELLEKKDE